MALAGHFAKQFIDFLVADPVRVAVRTRRDVAVLDGRENQPERRHGTFVLTEHRGLKGIIEL
jgi:hypothetical protein